MNNDWLTSGRALQVAVEGRFVAGRHLWLVMVNQARFRRSADHAGVIQRVQQPVPGSVGSRGSDSSVRVNATLQYHIEVRSAICLHGGRVRGINPNTQNLPTPRCLAASRACVQRPSWASVQRSRWQRAESISMRAQLTSLGLVGFGTSARLQVVSILLRAVLSCVTELHTDAAARYLWHLGRTQMTLLPTGNLSGLVTFS